jgi:DNA modification methylase
MELSRIKPNPANPRVIKDYKFKQLLKSIQDFPEMMEKRPMVCVTDVDKKIFPLGGNMRYRAIIELGYKDIPDSWVIMADDWTEEKRREFVIKDNVGFGEWNHEELANEWNTQQLEDWGLELPDFSQSHSFDLDSEDKETVAVQKLQHKFIVPPFSVLNTREGHWQERKKYWNVLIGDNGQTRDNIESKVNATVSNWENKAYTGGVIREDSISILDPVLSEIINKWFGLPNCKAFDCFAGDTVFGYVASYLGNNFTGIELRQEQADINNNRTKEMKANYICDDGRNILNHIELDSQDLLFSCPPYFDLEIYSDLPNDASNQKEYNDFISILDVAFTNAVKCLKENRFAVIVCGDVRDKKGNYYRFPDHIKDIFNKAGLTLYNELILIQSVGNGALRANRYMGSRKVVKMHEQVLVFYKGNTKEIKNIYPKIEIENESPDV